MGPGGTTTFDATLTQSLPPTSAGPWWPWLAALSVVVALGLGLAYGWWRSQDLAAAHHDSQPVQIAGDSGTADTAAQTGNGVSKEEQRLLDAVKQHERDGAPKYRVELGLFYVKSGKLDEAESVFKTLEDSAEKRQFNIAVGKVGKAIVLAFRDQSKESNDLMLPFTKQAKGGKGLTQFHPFWLYNPLLSEWVARALERNFANAPAAFPAALQAFRSPPAAKLKGAG
jgi:hypothetical protein